MDNQTLSIEKLLFTIRILRGKNGCPWDRKQTPATLQKYLREETDELLQALINNDPENICEEIGDVLYILLMLTEIFADQGIFSFQDSINEIDDKLRRRHPHVFDGKKIGSEEELRLQWKKIKNEEKRRNN